MTISEMTEKTGLQMPIAGGCQCGAVRYDISEQPLTLYVCHCTDCQRQSGSGFGMSMPVPRSGLRITKGEPSRWQRTTPSGQLVDCYYCDVCGSRLFHAPARHPKISNVKPGTLDDTKWLNPVGHLWTQSAQPWVGIPPGSLTFEQQPTDFKPLYEAWQAQWRGVQETRK